MGVIRRGDRTSQCPCCGTRVPVASNWRWPDAATATGEVIALRAQLAGAVEECERLREALTWYANGDHFPHPDYAARARSALRGPRGAGKP